MWEAIFYVMQMFDNNNCYFYCLIGNKISISKHLYLHKNRLPFAKTIKSFIVLRRYIDGYHAIHINMANKKLINFNFPSFKSLSTGK